MRQHAFTIDLPHSVRRLWDLFQRYDLEQLGPNRTRLRFRETFDLRTPVLRWFEGPIYRFIKRKNEASMLGAAAWLTAHPAFRADLVDPQ